MSTVPLLTQVEALVDVNKVFGPPPQGGGL